MRGRLFIGITLLFWIGWVGMARATHIHYENYRPDTVSFDSNDTFTWTFDLDNDLMSLWELPDSYVQNQSYDFDSNPENYPESFGSMSPEDILHYAYLTMRFIDVNGDCETENIDLVFDGTAIYFDDVTISQGGTGKIDVTTHLMDDHELLVTITANTGSFSVDWMNLKGCYETAAVPVPEPATLFLLMTGMSGLAGWKSRRKYSKT